MSKHEHEKVRSRNEVFSDRTATKIWEEAPSEDNPYIAEKAFCHGYDMLELMEKRSFVDVFFLLFRGELPSKDEAQLLEMLMVALINPGPRHPAARAAMTAGVGKTDAVHILPIASSVFGGSYLGGGNIESIIRMLRKESKKDAATLADQLLTKIGGDISKCEDGTITPGFGAKNGGIDLYTKSIADRLVQLPAAGKTMKWSKSFCDAIESSGMSWLSTGLAAAVFADLGFQPRLGGCLFQLLGSPGLIAHGVELANKPITAMQFVGDDKYFIEGENNNSQSGLAG